jgi:undecaprenyl-diphosphatase
MKAKIIPFFSALFLALALIPAPLSGETVNPVDKLFMTRYSATLDSLSDYTLYATMLAPAVFALASPQKDWPELGAMYVGSTALAYGSATLTKNLVVRERPYMYYDNPPQSLIDSGDYKRSFPSLHSTLVFSSAAFTAAEFYFRYPDSPYRVPLVATEYGLALTTAILRIGSGSHFLSDVAAGALIGTATGFLAPWIGAQLGFTAKSPVSLSVTPDQLAFTVRY